MAKAMMVECLSGDPTMRPTFEELDSQFKTCKAADIHPLESSDSTFATRSSQTDAMLKELANGNRSEDLLSKIFPEAASKALKESRAVEAQECACATVIVVSMVDFDKLVDVLAETKKVELIDKLYGCFQELCKKHGVFKIETNGKALMGVLNLVKDQPDHAKLAAQFSIDVLQAAQGISVDEENLDLGHLSICCLLYTSPSPRDQRGSRMPSSA